ncbi:hypothetical protein, partial [Flavobacterium sp.]|uniref:hypothetical protein n=1 Tax=Flavobacterium sp. TaxID=239 RepID=UPI002FDB7843
VNCVFNKLISQNNSFFKNVIINSFSSSKIANITFEIKYIPPTPTGTFLALTSTTYNPPGQNTFVKITLNTTFVANASTIQIAHALIHELIHAELMQRCIKLGLIEYILPDGRVKFLNNPVVFQDENEIFSALIQYYHNIPGKTTISNEQWNHDLFNVFNYRQKITENLLQINNILDPTNSFNNVLNNASLNPSNYTLAQVFEFMAWFGLEGTQDYIALPSTTQTDIINVENLVNANYTQTCN